MSYSAYGGMGDMDAAREFADGIGAASRDGPRGGRDFGRGGGRAGTGTRSNYLPPASRYEYNHNLATVPPARYFPTSMLNNAANQAALAAAAAAANNNNGGDDDAMDVDVTAKTAGSVPAGDNRSAIRPAQNSQASFGRADTAVPTQVAQTPSVWNNTAARDQPAQVYSGWSTTATSSQSAQHTSNIISPSDTPRTGSHALPIVDPRASRTLTPACGRTGSSPPRGTGRSRAPSPSRNLTSSRWADPAARDNAATGHTAPIYGASVPAEVFEHLNSDGLLKGTVFGVDRGAIEDDDWQMTFGCQRLIEHCGTVLKGVHAVEDKEAEQALNNVVRACNEFIHAKSHLRDQELTTKAARVLSKAQNDAWVHWVKYWEPVPLTADAYATAKANAAAQGKTASLNVEMEDVPAVVPQIRQDPMPRAFAFGNVTSQGSGANNSKSFADFAASNKAHPQMAHPQQVQPVFGGESGSSNGLQANTTTQAAQILTMPEDYPLGLPNTFDDPQAKLVFEDFFFNRPTMPRG